MKHCKPKVISCKLDREKDVAFIKLYEGLLNQLASDKAALFGDAVNPIHAVPPVGRWSSQDTPVAVAQSSGRDRLKIHGAIDLETGRTVMLLMAIAAMCPGKRLPASQSD